ncbi:insulinase family protein [Gillisia sp. M10.2A]|uniref:Insulinase family protein n=1 Tax=Gillisia lutea TaxID=2909668 RepID=A0ABS9EIP2_9FLAO|nr:insulinase family protein [Gillisia lutea]MCF4102217.1 insulinase family protein [Gillisia lutea]
MRIMKIAMRIFLLLLVGSTFAQDKDQFFTLNQKLPLDPSVRTGKLENGLTYYIKENKRPEDKAEMRLVINAGSILEDEDQQGLAHFVEHMAFNGTKNFKKNELIDYLQSIGVEFGADLNAHTGFDETVYKLSVPTDNEEIFNTSLQVLRDWADGLTFSNEEIDNERGVVAEELRARSGAGTRMYYKAIPVMTNNSRYAERLPIGKLDIILNSKYDAVKRFYREWYRPDLMALILVGDFDVDETEQKIQRSFSSLKNPTKTRERKLYDIPEAKEPKAIVITDEEARGYSASVYFKKNADPTVFYKDYKRDLLKLLYSGMLRERFNEEALKKDASFLSASAGIGMFLTNVDSYYLKANLKEDKILEGYKAMVAESERARRFGFTQGELERYKADLLTNAEFFKNEADKIPSRIFVERLIDLFTFNDPVVSEQFKYDFYKTILPTITLQEVNKIGGEWLNTSNVAIVINAPEDDAIELPSEERFLQILKSAKTMELSPYVDNLKNMELMTEKPVAGEIISSRYIESINTTVWKFANGVTVMAKPTTFQNDIISMSGFRPGGSSNSPDSIFVSAREAGRIVSESGLNNISAINLGKLNMGKNVKVTPYINYYDDLMSGSSSTKDLERMFEMTHLYFTAPNKDVNSFETHKERLKTLYKRTEDNPGSYFEEMIAKTMTQNDMRSIPLKVDQIESELNIDEAFQFYKERFSNANGFTFIFAGNFELDSIKDLSATYLGSLPSDTSIESNWRDFGMRRVTGRVQKDVYKGIEDKSQVDMRFTGTLKFTPEKAKELQILAKVLKIKLTEELREKMGGVYGVRVSGFATDSPYQWYRLAVQFTCSPENVEKLKTKVLEEIDSIKKDGVSPENINKVKEMERGNVKEFLKYDSFWISKIRESYENDRELDSFLNFEEEIESISSESLQEAANTYFDSSNYAEFILYPEE